MTDRLRPALVYVLVAIVGVAAFLYWAKQNKEWPFGQLPKDGWENGVPADIAAEQEA